MKTKNFFSIIAMFAMVLTTSATFAQSRSTVFGNANMVSNDNKSWALEVNGKVVTAYSYAHFQSTDGVYFAVENKDGKWGICDATGTFLFKCEFVKTSVSGNTAMLYTALNATPKIYNCSTKQYVQAEQAEADFFDKERDFNPEAMTRNKAVADAERLSSLVTPDGRFEIRMKGIRQELVVKGKVILECQEFRVITDEAYWNETGCWVFIVKNGGKYGTFCLGVWDENGKSNLEAVQFIPFEYTFIQTDPDRPGIVRCTTISGATVLKGFAGKDVK